ncbi:hypothetical protein CRG98_011810 [Punica granatum]|uniref:Uncharacterized protein n=1 Tax=Punica granatum TaxID=22663 RepID=A0A2I0KH01_PUNGR|nr:hypothetical protein CRG98_011810 [Punica granatum]
MHVRGARCTGNAAGMHGRRAACAGCGQARGRAGVRAGRAGVRRARACACARAGARAGAGKVVGTYPKGLQYARGAYRMNNMVQRRLPNGLAGCGACCPAGLQGAGCFARRFAWCRKVVETYPKCGKVVGTYPKCGK